MALNKPGLEAAIVAAFNGVKDYDGTAGKTQADAINKISADIATAVDTFVKTATVNTTVTVTSVTAVTPGAGVSGPGAGTGSGTLS